MLFFGACEKYTVVATFARQLVTIGDDYSVEAHFQQHLLDSIAVKAVVNIDVRTVEGTVLCIEVDDYQSAAGIQHLMERPEEVDRR